MQNIRGMKYQGLIMKHQIASDGRSGDFLQSTIRNRCRIFNRETSGVGMFRIQKKYKSSGPVPRCSLMNGNASLCIVWQSGVPVLARA